MAARHPEDLLSIASVAGAHGISKNHLMKVVQSLASGGFLQTLRGRAGGFRLARPAERITLGEVVRHTEPKTTPASCGTCVLNRQCELAVGLDTALEAFLAVLDATTLAAVAAATPSPLDKDFVPSKTEA